MNVFLTLIIKKWFLWRALFRNKIRPHRQISKKNLLLLRWYLASSMSFFPEKTDYVSSRTSFQLRDRIFRNKMHYFANCWHHRNRPNCSSYNRLSLLAFLCTMPYLQRHSRTHIQDDWFLSNFGRYNYKMWLYAQFSRSMKFNETMEMRIRVLINFDKKICFILNGEWNQNV